MNCTVKHKACVRACMRVCVCVRAADDCSTTCICSGWALCTAATAGQLLVHCAEQSYQYCGLEGQCFSTFDGQTVVLRLDVGHRQVVAHVEELIGRVQLLAQQHLVQRMKKCGDATVLSKTSDKPLIEQGDCVTKQRMSFTLWTKKSGRRRQMHLRSLGVEGLGRTCTVTVTMTSTLAAVRERRLEVLRNAHPRRLGVEGLGGAHYQCRVPLRLVPIRILYLHLRAATLLHSKWQINGAAVHTCYSCILVLNCNLFYLLRLDCGTLRYRTSVQRTREPIR